ncbi:two-component system sensor histidine kinase CreC [Arenimonas composti]|uniref:histidine kinase n=1 Tax=Arenimonas composti TR7-09 = DSM 18010 TaxID=1121013 RepID=A0A091BC50_9GAMM|nr:two-component system sensor histidine kinase CreC [Arenimonas composti]KFN49097.1 hypothetical protein P873_12455 [Arenimonas composti TR7-09 = DSM 18010]
MRIGLRILLGTFLVVAAAALLLTQVFVAEVKPGVRQTMEDTLVDMANVLAELATDDLLAGRIGDGDFARRVRAMAERDPGAEIWGFPKRDTSTRVTITDARGIVVFDSEGRDLGADHSRWNDVLRTLRGEYGARSTLADPADPNSSVMHVAAPIRDDAGAVVGALTVSRPNRAIAPFVERSQAIVTRWGIALLALALVVGLATAAWLGGQLGRLRRYAQAVTAGERVPLPRTAGEFAELGAALETMRERLEGRQYVEDYVQALTHEMKSPLAAIRASAELLERPLPAADQAQFAATIRGQSERLAAMIDRMLALAAVEHRRRIDAPQRLAVTALLQQVAHDLAPKLQARALGLSLPADGDATVSGDAFLLRQALANLVDNAADFAPAGSTIETRLETTGRHVAIHVADRGPGIPDYARERVFERFYSLPRPDGQRSSGLGLTFVAEVATLHGGGIRLAPRDVGGTVATLSLPRA